MVVPVGWGSGGLDTRGGRGGGGGGEVVVIGVDREGGQRRGEIGGGREEIGRTTNGLEVKKMIGRVRTG